MPLPPLVTLLLPPATPPRALLPMPLAPWATPLPLLAMPPLLRATLLLPLARLLRTPLLPSSNRS